jgi:hypothetical protein
LETGEKTNPYLAVKPEMADLASVPARHTGGADLTSLPGSYDAPAFVKALGPKEDVNLTMRGCVIAQANRFFSGFSVAF